MKNKTRLFNVLIIFALFLSACNLPSGNGNEQGEGLSLTAAAQTVEALLSATPAVANTATDAPALTITLIPSPIFTSTPAATATPNSVGAIYYGRNDYGWHHHVSGSELQ